MKRAAWALGLLGIMLAGCGGGGGDGPDADPFTRTSSGYPVVSGTYSMAIGTVTNNCSGPTVGPQIASNVIVSQAESTITAQATSTAGLDALLASGWTVESASEAAGTVLKDARFSIFEGVTLSHATLGRLSVNYAYTGIFSPTSWSGTESYTVFAERDTSSCTFTAPFSGDKV